MEDDIEFYQQWIQCYISSKLVDNSQLIVGVYFIYILQNIWFYLDDRIDIFILI